MTRLVQGRPLSRLSLEPKLLPAEPSNFLAEYLRRDVRSCMHLHAVAPGMGHTMLGCARVALGLAFAAQHRNSQRARPQHSIAQQHTGRQSPCLGVRCQESTGRVSECRTSQARTQHVLAHKQKKKGGKSRKTVVLVLCLCLVTRSPQPAQQALPAPASQSHCARETPTITPVSMYSRLKGTNHWRTWADRRVQQRSPSGRTIIYMPYFS